MIPANVDPQWYRTYWFDEWPPETDRPAAHLLGGSRAHRGSRPRAGGKPHRIDPALLALALLFAALAVGAVLISLAAPVPPADLPYFMT